VAALIESIKGAEKNAARMGEMQLPCGIPVLVACISLQWPPRSRDVCLLVKKEEIHLMRGRGMPLSWRVARR
jgi:hypothetical protein